MKSLFILLCMIVIAPISNAQTGQITGQITSKDTAKLPAKSIIEVSLIDASLADAPSKTLASKKIKGKGKKFPVPFKLKYDPRAIRENMDYRIQARITLNGKLLFINTTSHSVLTRGNSEMVDIVVDPIINYPPPVSQNHQLENTDWKLVELNGTGVSSANKLSLPYIHLDSKEKRLSGSGGCNRLIGGYKLDGAKLDFPSVGSTRMFCDGKMELESKFTKALEDTTNYRIIQDILELMSNDHKLLVRLKAFHK